MTPAEQDAGITFADVDIDVSRCRGTDCKTRCPRCWATHSPGRQGEQDLSVHLERGVWNCHRCGWKSGLTAEKAQRDGWKAGMVPGTGQRFQRKSQQTAAPAAKPATPIENPDIPASLDQEGVDYLIGRGITMDVAERYGLVSARGMLFMPYLVDGCVVNWKGRGMKPGQDGKRTFTQAKGGAKSLFGVDQADGSDAVVLTEGELDAVSCAVAGWPAMSPPNGAPGRILKADGTPDLDPDGKPKVASIGNKLDALYEPKSAQVLAAATRVVIATDGDLEGEAFRDAMIAAVGADRCWTVTWPDGCKDANDVLVKFGAGKLDEVLAAARPSDIPGITEFRSERSALYHIHQFGYDRGVETRWQELNRIFRPRKGTMNLVTGIPGMGKTTFMMDLFCGLAMQHGWKGAIFSPESGDTGNLYAKLVQVATDHPILPGADHHMPLELLDAGADWVDQYFCRFDAAPGGEQSYGTVPLDEVVRRIEAMALRRGLDMVYIDPWNRIGTGADDAGNDTEYIGRAINTLHRVAIRHKLFLVMTAHPTKMDDDEAMPTAYNIAGSAHWYNMADAILGIQRNKTKEPINRTTVRVLKHRYEGISGNIGECYFWMDGRSNRFYTDPQQIPMVPGTQSWVTPKADLAPMVAAAPWEA